MTSQSQSSATAVSAKTLFQDTDAFDVDPHTGFMPPRVPLTRLPATWEPWEAILDDAMRSKLQLGDKPGLTPDEAAISESWRVRVRQMPVLPIEGLLDASSAVLRRAHLVLAYILHFYVQSLPPDAPVRIPRSLTLPLLRVSASLDIPPVLTYADTVLYNWVPRTAADADISSGSPTPPSTPTLDTLRTHTSFTSTLDEEEFYLTSARIELRGVAALDLMRATLDEAFVGDSTAVRRIASYLRTLSHVVHELRAQLLDVKRACGPERYYNDVRPWFRGEDSDPRGRTWTFEGVDELAEAYRRPKELSGPSAGQSSIVHVLDVFLGVEHLPSSSSSPPSPSPSFMSRMKVYMPRPHRLFLDHLARTPRPLRAFVDAAQDDELRAAFNDAVRALKEFRDAHMIIAALYILGPARRARERARADGEGEAREVGDKAPLKGTGGTDLVKFLKDTRTRTNETMLS